MKMKQKLLIALLFLAIPGTYLVTQASPLLSTIVQLLLKFRPLWDHLLSLLALCLEEQKSISKERISKLMQPRIKFGLDPTLVKF